MVNIEQYLVSPIKERRQERRIPLSILIYCSPVSEGGEEKYPELEMWTYNLSNQGARLHWSRWWRCRGCSLNRNWGTALGCRQEKCSYQEQIFTPGSSLHLQELPPAGQKNEFWVARTVWSREILEKDIYEVGIFFLMPRAKAIEIAWGPDYKIQ